MIRRAIFWTCATSLPVVLIATILHGQPLAKARHDCRQVLAYEGRC